MKPSADLFLLIQSLSPAEKRYFRVQAMRFSGESESNSVRLFDAIHQQTEYDEDAIKAKFVGESIARNLPSEKNYLFSLILRTMRAFHEEHSVDSQLRNLMQEVDFLYERKLFGPCKKILLKAMALAEKYDRFPAQLGLIDMEVRLHKVLTKNGLFAAMKALELKRNDLSIRIKLDAEVANAYDKIYAQAILHYLPGKEIEWDGEQWIRQFSQNTAHIEKLSFRRKLILHSTLAILAQLGGNRSEMQEEYERTFILYQQFPHFQEDDPITFFRAIGNLLAGYHFNFQYEKFEPLLQMIFMVANKSFEVELAKLQIGHYYQLLYFLVNANWKGALKFEKDWDLKWEMFRPKIGLKTMMGFQYNFGLVHLFRGKPAMAIKWFHSILNLAKSEIRNDLRIASELLLLAAHADLGNWDWLADQVRNLRRVFERKDARNEFENLILAFFYRLCQAAPQKRNGVFHNLEDELSQVAHKDDFRQRTGFHEFRIWALHHSTGAATETLIPNYWKNQIQLENA